MLIISMFILCAEASCSSLDAPQNGGKVFAMRHGVKKARLGRPADQRKAVVRGLVTEVLRHGKIKTTKVRYWIGCAGKLGTPPTFLPLRHGCGRLCAVVWIRQEKWIMNFACWINV